ncbi:hypothetical protein CK203_020820 [Vitis vinifera]|nr:hypothetical protein CK203_020820 [Vitis vinifera]
MVAVEALFGNSVDNGAKSAFHAQIAYFVEPSHDCLVECLPTCKSDKNPPKFPPVKCGTYLTQRYKDTHADLNLYTKHQA